MKKPDFPAMIRFDEMIEALKANQAASAGKDIEGVKLACRLVIMVGLYSDHVHFHDMGMCGPLRKLEANVAMAMHDILVHTGVPADVRMRLLEALADDIRDHEIGRQGHNHR